MNQAWSGGNLARPVRSKSSLPHCLRGPANICWLNTYSVSSSCRLHSFQVPESYLLLLSSGWHRYTIWSLEFPYLYGFPVHTKLNFLFSCHLSPVNLLLSPARRTLRRRGDSCPGAKPCPKVGPLYTTLFLPSYQALKVSCESSSNGPIADILSPPVAWKHTAPWGASWQEEEVGLKWTLMAQNPPQE